MNNISIDLETLGTRYDAPIISIGAVYFDPETEDIGTTFYAEVDLADALRHGTADASSIAWWMQQSESARAVFSGSQKKEPLACVLCNLYSFAKNHDVEVRVWGNGATFDITILEHAFARCGLEIPWEFWNIRDMRTAVELANLSHAERPVREGVHHNALDDATHQARVISAAWRKVQGAVPLPPASPCAMTESEYRLFKLGWLEAEAAHGIKRG